MPTAPTANDLTRQQLDELDALLQRMLNLPLTGTEPPAAPPPPPGPTWRYDAPAAPPAPAPHLMPEPPRPVAPPPAPVIALEPPPAPVVVAAPPAPVVAAAPPAPMPPPEPAAPIIVRVPTPPSAPTPVPVVAKPAVAVVPAPPAPVLLWPLVAVNWVFDRAAGLLGPPGWVLRSGFGKNLLGLVGLGLIAYTAAHLATQAGWVRLPFPVPWPR